MIHSKIWNTSNGPDRLLIHDIALRNPRRVVMMDERWYTNIFIHEQTNISIQTNRIGRLYNKRENVRDSWIKDVEIKNLL